MHQHRARLGKFIFISSLSLLILVAIYYFLGGFTLPEFSDLIKRLAPIKAVYLTALVKYIIANPHAQEGQHKGPPLSKNYILLSNTIIGIHMLSLILLVSLTAFFNAPSFEVMTNAIVGVETFFGLYVGMFLTNLFEEKTKAK